MTAPQIPYITKGAKRAVMAIAVLLLVFGAGIGFTANRAIGAADEANNTAEGLEAEVATRAAFDARRVYDICIEANERDDRKLMGLLEILEPFKASPSYEPTVWILSDAFGPRDCDARLKEARTGP